jgi:hypothetical protein
MGISYGPAVVSFDHDTFHSELLGLDDLHPSLKIKLRAHEAIQKLRLTSSCLHLACYHPSSGIQARLWAAEKYLSFADLQPHVKISDSVEAPNVFKAFYHDEEEFMDIFETLGFSCEAIDI